METIRDVYKKLANVENKDIVVSVFDGHSEKNVDTKVYGIYKNSELIDFVGIDADNNIVAIVEVDTGFKFENHTSYGVIKDDGLVYSWYMDRDGHTIPNLESSGYYKER